MLHKTRGIVFRFTKYGETSIIVNIFTHLFGLQGYIVNGVRTKSARNTISLYQPLTLLDLVVYHRENAKIMRIKEVKCLHPYLSIPNDIRKSTIAMFLNELMNKAVKDQTNNDRICDFFIQSFIALDHTPHPDNFHLVFLIRLSRSLGFGPQTTYDVLEGQRVSVEEDLALRALLSANYDTGLVVSYESRKNLLDLLLAFYRRHIDNMGEIRSVDVLREILT